MIYQQSKLSCSNALMNEFSGATVAEIFNRTGCRVQILESRAGDEGDRVVTFEGTEKQINEARAIVEGIIEVDIIFFQFFYLLFKILCWGIYRTFNVI